MWDSFSFYLSPPPPCFISYFLHLSPLLSFALASTCFQDLSMQETPVAPSFAALKEKAPFHCTGSYSFKVITVIWLVRFGPHANHETRMGSTWPKPQSLRVEDRLWLEENQSDDTRRQEMVLEQMKLTGVTDIIKSLQFFKVYLKWLFIIETFHLLNWMWFLPSLNSQSILFVLLLWKLPYLNCIIFIIFCDHINSVSSNPRFIKVPLIRPSWAIECITEIIHILNWIDLLVNIESFQVGSSCT